MRIQSYVLIIIYSFLFTSPLISQKAEWLNFTNGDKVFKIITKEQTIWLATNGGLVKINKNTDEVCYYNKANSGIPDNNLLTIAADSLNNIWIGTKYFGIAKFDINSEKCTIYNSENSDLPFDQWNTEIEVDAKGNIWIGSLKWLSKYNDLQWSIYETDSPVSTFTSINDIYFDQQDTMWVGASWGLGKVENNKLIEQYKGFAIEVNAIQKDKENSIWLATHKGLYKYDGQNFSVFDTTNSELLCDNIYDLKLDLDGNIWLATANGLVKFDGSSFVVYNPDNPDLLKNTIISLAIDENNYKWIGLLGDGLMKFNGKNWEKYNTSNSILHSNQILDIEIDNSNNLYLATGGGLIKYEGSKWQFFNNENSELLNSNVMTIYGANDGTLLIGSVGYNCLSRYDGSKFDVFDSTNSILKEEMIEAIRKDDDDNIWLATWRGIVKYDGNNWTRYNTTNTPLTSNIISDIVFDLSGNLWISMVSSSYDVESRGGLAKYDGENWLIYTKDNSDLPQDDIDCLSLDIKDNIWIGTMSGLVKYDNESWTNYNSNNSEIISNGIRDIFCVNDTVIIGTVDGLSILINECQWYNFNVTNSGLSYNYIWAVNKDDLGNIWIGTSEGGLSVYQNGGVVTSVKNNCFLPCGFKLHHNYPNPFNPTTTISYQIPEAGFVTLKVYDMLGREVASLVNNKMEAGKYSVNFNASNLGSGVYIYRVETNTGYAQSKKMILLK